jgi:hypothetical protein
MKIAVLAPGPSLSLTYEPSGHAHVIGINRAVLGFACDWWAFTDWQPFLHYHHFADLPRLGLFFSGTALDELLRRGMATRMQDARLLLPFEDIDPARTRDALRWGLFTAPAALMLARHLGATSIDVFGADWQVDAADWDGVAMPGNNRDEARWKNEAVIWNGVVEHLQPITVTRHTPGDLQRPA